jgi:DNA-directed RNA polymerase subunit H (RpoH/RPB5)
MSLTFIIESLTLMEKAKSFFFKKKEIFFDDLTDNYLENISVKERELLFIKPRDSILKQLGEKHVGLVVEKIYRELEDSAKEIYDLSKDIKNLKNDLKKETEPKKRYLILENWNVDLNKKLVRPNSDLKIKDIEKILTNLKYVIFSEDKRIDQLIKESFSRGLILFKEILLQFEELLKNYPTKKKKGTVVFDWEKILENFTENIFSKKEVKNFLNYLKCSNYWTKTMFILLVTGYSARIITFTKIKGLMNKIERDFNHINKLIES